MLCAEIVQPPKRAMGFLEKCPVWNCLSFWGDEYQITSLLGWQALEYYERVRAEHEASSPALWARMQDCHRALGREADAAAIYTDVLHGQRPPLSRLLVPLM